MIVLHIYLHVIPAVPHVTSDWGLPMLSWCSKCLFFLTLEGLLAQSWKIRTLFTQMYLKSENWVGLKFAKKNHTCLLKVCLWMHQFYPVVQYKCIPRQESLGIFVLIFQTFPNKVTTAWLQIVSSISLPEQQEPHGLATLYLTGPESAIHDYVNGVGPGEEGRPPKIRGSWR